MNFVCVECNMPFLNDNKLQKHRLDFHGMSANFVCTFADCKMVYPSLRTMRKHAREEHAQLQSKNI